MCINSLRESRLECTVRDKKHMHCIITLFLTLPTQVQWYVIHAEFNQFETVHSTKLFICVYILYSKRTIRLPKDPCNICCANCLLYIPCEQKQNYILSILNLLVWHALPSPLLISCHEPNPDSNKRTPPACLKIRR